MTTHGPAMGTADLEVARQTGRAIKMRETIFITGAGSGIGRATAELFAARGWRVGLADVDESGLRETLSLLASPERHAVYLFDVRDRDSWIAALADFTIESQAKLNIVLNNAGIGHRQYLHETSAEMVERVIDVNLKGFFWGAQAAFPYLRATSKAALINTCSVAGIFAPAQMAPYSASKFAIRALTESLEREWREFDIKVRSIIPGFVDTEMLSNVNAGTNRTTRESVVKAGLEISSAVEVASAVWKAYGGKRVHVYVGRTSRVLRIVTRWGPWFLP
ncbi:SDR family oxidoreductase [Sphingobium subterraneum]|uniref:NAD(P)-dependent dehydrogenase (Short-subunit alcohol dehydrogenase family) n=1 Tax=Sphingobium subterraneum TaxID=627688 RepID=A0A841IXL7_9SPHN|nr:SDR family oxidoreductase [Sphingobium subterraneum]MBB6122882.1 NAD(P)-dependent dehydrogenase (short-subunit alcohol dehydrogenase family) [Sphingobium subterraneum]